MVIFMLPVYLGLLLPHDVFCDDELVVFVYCYAEKALSDTVHKCCPQLRKLYLHHDMAAFCFLVYHIIR
jgi:hypothetical protein